MGRWRVELRFIECKFGFRMEWGLAGGGMGIDLVAYSKCFVLLDDPQIIKNVSSQKKSCG